MTLEDTAKKRIDHLVHFVSHHDHQYHVLNDPEISDKEYDKALRKLKELEEKFPAYIHSDSPTKKVGTYSKDQVGTITHMNKMYSLDNVFSYDEFIAWIRLRNLPMDTMLYGDLKADGLAIAIRYDNGKLQHISSRGNGFIGEDLSRHMYLINGIAKTVLYTDKHEIYGEVILDRDEFKNINEIRDQEGLSLYSNQRNAAAGILNSHSNESTKRLEFYAYGSNRNGYNKHSEMIADLESEGFAVLESCYVSLEEDDLIEAKEFHNAFNNLVDKTLPCDGTVWRFDDMTIQTKLGYTEKYPRFAKAWKFTDAEKRTKILDIRYQIGRTGVITPVAEIEPVNVDGVFITQATMHNEQEIQRKGLGKGNIVNIYRAGGVVPAIKENISRSSDSVSFVPLKKCPCCNTKLVSKSASTKVCPNTSCPAVVRARFYHSIGKKGLCIKGLGNATIDKLLKDGKLHKLKDIFLLDHETLIPIIGDKNTEKVLNNIKICLQKMDIPTMLKAIGIPGMDSKSIKAIDNNCKDVNDIIQLSKSIPKMREIGMSNTGITSLMSYISDGGDKELIDIYSLWNK